MRLQVAKWGNSLAVRLPVEYTRQVGLEAGDVLEVAVTPMGELMLSPNARPLGQADLRRLRTFLDGQEERPAVIEEMRERARY
jgi:antitoxin MazE